MCKRPSFEKSLTKTTKVQEIRLISAVESKVKKLFQKEGSGHDWHHIARVRNTALHIGEAEGGDLQVIELAALLHDIADHKFHNNDLTAGPRKARAIILEHGGSADLAEAVSRIVAEVSFKGAEVETPVSSLEAAVVQDSDRLDAIGAIGIARAFAYGGHKNRLLFDPEKKPKNHTTFEEYSTDQGHTINHFYEKLLLLKDRMHTKTAKEMAMSRHRFMEEYLEQFFAEWEGIQ